MSDQPMPKNKLDQFKHQKDENKNSSNPEIILQE